jgi:DNA-binding LacI/PurR family transcriptional regulator
MVVALIGDANNTYFSEILAGIQDQASRQGVLVNVVVNDGDPLFSQRFCRWIARSSALGLIICSSSGIPEQELVRLRDQSRIPVAAINRIMKTDGFPSVRIDYERAMESLVRYLVKFRHRRIAFLSGSEGSYSALSKQRGVESTLEKLGFPLDPALFVERSSTVEGGFQAMNLLLDLPVPRRPTAVIASNDLIALGAMHGIRMRGLAIPADMSVTGFDDIAMAAHANPPLTSIAPPKFERGSRAMQFILALGEAEPTAREEYLIMESPLIVRESTGPCPE